MRVRRFIPFNRPWTDGSEIAEVTESIRSGWLTTGPKVRRLEKSVARLVGARHAIAVNSCTAALHLSLAAAGIGPGDEVVTSPYTFAATGEAILYLGARPVFADIDPATLNLDPDQVRRRISRRTRALLPVHIAGLPCDLTAMRTLARQHRLTIIDDAAHALGSAIGRQAIGGDRLTDMTCFSFYATKNLTTGEGGMVTCGDTRMAGRIRRLSLHGLSRDAWKRYSRGGTWRYDVVDLGFKYNLTDVAAGIGLAQIAKFRTMQRTRRRLALEYTRLLRAQEAFDLPAEVPGTTHAWHLYVIRLRPRVLRLDRAALIEALRVRGIGTSVHFMPLHLFSFYRRTFGYRSGSYPHTERESARVISLPLYPGLADADQGRVVDVLFETARRYRR